MLKIRNGDWKLLVGFSGSLLVLILLVFDWLKPLEMLSYDLRFKLRGAQKSLPSIAIVEIADDSIQAFGRWPWARKYHGALISILSQSGAAAVLYDVLFTEPSDAPDDAVLEAALKVSGKVYLPCAFEVEKKDGQLVYGTEYKPLEQFSRWAKGLGQINIQPDSDGVIRRIPLVIEREGKFYPSIALQVYLDHEGVPFERLKFIKGKPIEVPLPDGRFMRIAVDRNYQMLINWAGVWNDTFRHYSFAEVIRAFKQKSRGETPSLNLDEFKDSFSLVGLTAIGLTDLKPVPIEPIYPGIGVHANALQNLLERKWIRALDKSGNAALMLIAALVTSLGLLRRKPVSGAVFTLTIVLLYFAVSYVSLAVWGVWISAVYPILAIIFNYLATTIYTQVTLAIERTRLFNLATRDGLTGLFNIRHFKLLLEAEFNSSKEKKKPLCVIMSDIDHFKKFNDTYGHQVGDLVIRETGKVFRASGRDLDVPARYGGEELIMMLPNTRIEDAAMVAERIRKNVESHEYKDEKGSYKVTVSLGVSCLNVDSNIEELIKRADEALYKSKEGGRNRVEVSN